MKLEITIHALPAKPDESTDVILIAKLGYTVSTHYSKEHDKFNAYDGLPPEHAFNNEDFIGWIEREEWNKALGL